MGGSGTERANDLRMTGRVGGKKWHRRKEITRKTSLSDLMGAHLTAYGDIYFSRRRHGGEEGVRESTSWEGERELFSPTGRGRMWDLALQRLCFQYPPPDRLAVPLLLFPAAFTLSSRIPPPSPSFSLSLHLACPPTASQCVKSVCVRVCSWLQVTRISFCSD